MIDKEYIKECSLIPDFINTCSEIQKEIYEYIYTINHIMEDIFSDKILEDDEIKIICNSFRIYMRHINYLMILEDKDLNENIKDYYDEMFSYYFNKAINNENYEMANNIKKLLDYIQWK